MEDKSLPQAIGQNIAEPLFFPDQDELCRRLDEFYKASGQQPGMSFSFIFRGALYAMRYEYREENPDWMAQVAHSLREIIYPFHSSKKRGMAFKNYGSTYDIEKSIQDSGRYYNFITNIAHHNFIKAGQNSLIGGSKDNAVKVTPEVFEIVVRQFAKILFAILRRQIDAHKEIDRIFEARPNNTIIANAKSLKDLNPDAHQYFFAKADENWLSWLWENGFLDAIKQKAKEPARYTYNIPELYYLVRMAEKKPEQVADIMLKVSISKETLNSEVIDQFLHICIDLPAKELARIVPKIQQENWVKLIAAFNEWGFEYKKMFQTLADTKDYKGILMLAEAVLSVRTGEESIQTSRGFLSDNPFYLKDLLYTEVFNYLTSVDDEHAEQALELTVKIMTKVILLSGKAKSSEVFPVQDFYYLSDIDFFSLSLSEKEHLSYRDNVRELTATIKILTQRLIGERCSKESYIRFIHEKYIKTLPENKSMWRLRLFVLSLCPKVFKDELKKVFSRLFKVIDDGKSYFYIDSGTEYKKALKKSFAVLGREYQREYIEKVFKYFGGNFKDKEEEKLHKQNGWQILSSICRYLTVKEKEKCEEIFGNKCDSAFEPVPSIGPTEGGWISDRGPISKERFNKLKISAIAEKLRTEWRPENLQKKNTYNDFLNPINAEGVGEQLKDDINKRLQDYVKNANLFFKRDVIDQHYTYSFFRGIHEAVHSNRTNAESLNWNGLIELCLNIKKEGEREPFNREMRERHEFDTWLSGWEDVHSAMAQTIKELIREVEGRIVIDFLKYRDKIFKIISYLLDYPHPIPEDEEPETAIIKSQSPGDNTYIVSDPFSIAITTVRGQTFEALVFFVYQDGKRFTKEEKIKIFPDVKKLYETVLEKEKTRALMFMFGYYLPAFYFRDREWIHRLLPEIFPEKLEKKHLYLASWEGYLVNKLYEEIFFDPYFQKLYKRGLAFTGKEDPKRKFFKDPDESIAAHFALAFVVFHNRFGFDHPLFKAFWKDNIKRQAVFISFIGRIFISGNDAKANSLLENNSESRERLKELWDWILGNFDNPELFTEFGFWINLNKNIFNVSWLVERVKRTLKRTNGVLSWDHGLTKSIAVFAKDSPADALEIVRIYLLEGGVRSSQLRMPFLIDNNWLKAFQLLYKNKKTRNGTYSLINNLIKEGGSTFWKLKEISQ